MANELHNFEVVLDKLNKIEAELAQTSHTTRKLLQNRLQDAKNAVGEAFAKIMKAADAGDPEARKFVSDFKTLLARSN